MDAEDDLRRAIDTFERAIRDRDVELAETVLDDDYTLQLMRPVMASMPRARWLEALAEYMVHGYAVHHQIVDVDGDCATVLQRVSMEATVLGQDRSGTVVITDVWRLRPEGWRVWRRHSTPLEAGQMPGA